jgi:multicomponent Na+:H+ antiporter subunit E
MTHIISLTITLSLLWLGLSGHFEPLMLAIGVASVFLVLFITLRMEAVDRTSYPIHFTGSLFRFWRYLVREIILSNIDVIRRILTPGKSISPQMITLPLPQKSDLAKVMYANAISLTPGTVSVQLDRDTIMVHALSKEAADALETGDMASRVPDDEASS